MRIGLASAAALGLAATIVGCGGKVVVDTPNGGGGGAGGTGSTTTTGTTTITGVNCDTTACSASSDGSCECDGACNGQKLQVQCQPIQGGASCTCSENGVKIAVCQQPGGAFCGLLDECCAAEFFGQAGGG